MHFHREHFHLHDHDPITLILHHPNLKGLVLTEHKIQITYQEERIQRVVALYPSIFVYLSTSQLSPMSNQLSPMSNVQSRYTCISGLLHRTGFPLSPPVQLKGPRFIFNERRWRLGPIVAWQLFSLFRPRKTGSALPRVLYAFGHRAQHFMKCSLL